MPARSSYQRFEAELISRQDIKNAPYNPRIMDKDAAKRLRESLSQHGLVEPPIWNRRTGNIVGGHQRLKQLDALEHGKNYSLTVSVVDVDESEEAKLNVLLNNQDLMGDWDFDKLSEMTKDFDITLDDMGFSAETVDMMFDGDDRFSALLSNDDVEGVKADMGEMRAARDEIRKDAEGNNDINYYVTIVFKDDYAKSAFLRRISIQPWEQYVTEDQIERLVTMGAAGEADDGGDEG